MAGAGAAENVRRTPWATMGGSGRGERDGFGVAITVEAVPVVCRTLGGDGL